MSTAAITTTYVLTKGAFEDLTEALDLGAGREAVNDALEQFTDNVRRLDALLRAADEDTLLAVGNPVSLNTLAGV